jgi:hypothetical protein
VTVDSTVNIIEVLYKKYVTDTVSENVMKAVKDLCILKKLNIKVGYKCYLYGKVSRIILNKIITRNPTDIEIETIAQTWSEHCKHKTCWNSKIYRVW